MKSKPKARSTPQVALLLETSTEFGRGLLRGILRYSHLHGPWDLYVAPGHLNQALPKVTDWKGTGIIARMRSEEMGRLIRETGLPFVASSLRESGEPAYRSGYGEIRTDSEAIAQMAAEHLLQAGFRSFAFCGFANLNWSAQREKSIVQLLKERGYGCPTHRLAEANWMQRPNWIESWNHEQPILIKWLQSLPMPVGLMTCNDACGREVLQACAAAGLHVPDQVAVVGVDNDEMMCELSNPPLSSVALDLSKAGYEAAHLLDALMSGLPAKEKVVWVRPTRVAVRGSSDVVVQDDPVIARALQFIREHARENLGVGNIAEGTGVSRRTLERRFYRAIHRTVHSEIMRSHLDRAKQLLLETDLPCHRIAIEAGFGSLKTFNREFGRREGVTPQNFRRGANGAASRKAKGEGPVGVNAPPPKTVMPRTRPTDGSPPVAIN
ncbi:MAG: substrate-binding domain-containing protein [Deltaproteobacteria bacterium]